MTECDEVAENMRPPHFASFDEASKWVRTQMGDQGYQIIDNVAEALIDKQDRKEARDRTPKSTFTFELTKAEAWDVRCALKKAIEHEEDIAVVNHGLDTRKVEVLKRVRRQIEQRIADKGAWE